MKALGEEIPTVDAQIGGHYTMDPKDALRRRSSFALKP